MNLNVEAIYNSESKTRLLKTNIPGWSSECSSIADYKMNCKQVE